MPYWPKYKIVFLSSAVIGRHGWASSKQHTLKPNPKKVSIKAQNKTKEESEFTLKVLSWN